MNLLSLQPARLSLEFTQAEFEAVKAGLRFSARKFRKSPQIIRRSGATHDVLEVGGARLVLMIDDGDPCLVSMSPRGDALLRETMSHVAATMLRRGETPSKRHDERLTRSGQLARA